MDTNALKKLVGVNLGKALEDLEKLYQDQASKYNKVILLQSRLQELSNNNAKGLFSADDAWRLHNKLVDDTLNFIDNPDVITIPELPRLEIRLIHPEKIIKDLLFSRINPRSAEDVLRPTMKYFWVSTIWKFQLIIYNNSGFAAYNPRLEFPKMAFTSMDPLEEFPPIQPGAKVELTARYMLKSEKTKGHAYRYIESTELDSPSNFEELEILLHYKNEDRVPITNRFWIKDGKGYNEIISG